MTECPSTPSILGGAQHELGRLRPREEAERDEGRAEARGDVGHRRGVAVDALTLAGARMREQQLPTRVRDADLPAVEMAGEDELVRARGQPAADPREVAEEDAQVGVVRGEP